jgi:hypothetical protein
VNEFPASPMLDNRLNIDQLARKHERTIRALLPVCANCTTETVSSKIMSVFDIQAQR